MNSDTWFCIFQHLDVKGLCLLSKVCKKLYDIVNHSVIWKQLFINKYSNLRILQPTYKECYKLCYQLTKLNNQFQLSVNLNVLLTLTKIDLSHKYLTDIPKELSALTNLRELYLDNNQIRKIPKELSSLINLQWLELGSNQITEFPKELSALTSLRELSLYSNQITEIPKEFKKNPFLRI